MEKDGPFGGGAHVAQYVCVRLGLERVLVVSVCLRECACLSTKSQNSQFCALRYKYVLDGFGVWGLDVRVLALVLVSQPAFFCFWRVNSRRNC